MARTHPKGQLKLGAFFHPTGNHVAAWLHPDSQIDAGTNFAHYVRLAQTAERAKFDLIFLADAAATRDGPLQVLSRWPQYMAFFDPLTLLAGIAAVTQHIGLVATATTSYNEPYNVARRFASLDHMSGGRAGWNVVTSSNQSEALNFGRKEHFAHGERYERAREFVEVVRGLWDSYDDDAFVRDRTTARYFIPEKLHHLNHKGKYFAVRGPLNTARPPQGYPVLAQAGASDVGMEFAAEIGEIIFTPLLTLERAKAFSAEIKGRAAKYGREPSSIKIMPGLNPIVAPTDDEAERKHQYLQSLIHPDVGRILLSTELGIDLLPFPVDGPLPFHLIPAETNAGKGTLQHVLDMARRDNLSIRELYLRYAGARGQRTIKGSPKRVADDMEQWFIEDGVDGFLIQPPILPGGLDDFVTLVIPELQKRGLFRTEYEGRTLRDRLGLLRPPSRYVRSSGA